MPDIIEDILALSFIYQARKKTECPIYGSLLEADKTCSVFEEDLDEDK